MFGVVNFVSPKSGLDCFHGAQKRDKHAIAFIRSLKQSLLHYLGQNYDTTDSVVILFWRSTALLELNTVHSTLFKRQPKSVIINKSNRPHHYRFPISRYGKNACHTNSYYEKMLIVQFHKFSWTGKNYIKRAK